MSLAIRYYSKTGHMKKMAEAIAEVTNAEAKSINEPVSEPVDTLFYRCRCICSSGRLVHEEIHQDAFAR